MRKSIVMLASLVVVVGTMPAMTRPGNVVEAAEEDEGVQIKPGSALDLLRKEVEKHEMTRVLSAKKAVEANAAAKVRRRRGIDLSDWLKAHYLRNHPEARVVALAAVQDPTEGFPLALESLQSWMLRHQDLRPDAAPKARAAARVGVGPNVRISGANTTPRSESDIRINYGNPNQIISGSNNLGESRQAQFFSSDGGVTWGQTTLPLLPGDSLHSDPTVDWATDGTAWATTIGIDASTTILQMRAYRFNRRRSDLDVRRHLFGRQELCGQAVDVDRPQRDLTVQGQHLRHLAQQPAGLCQPAALERLGPPLQVTGAETTGTAIGGDITTNANGEVFAVWPDTGSRNLFIAKSTDGGATFKGPSAGAGPEALAKTFGSFQISVPAFANRSMLIYASIAAFRNGTRNDVYVSWPDLSGEPGCDTPTSEPAGDVNSPCKSRIWFTRSVNGGATWEAARIVNPLPDASDQFNHRLAVDPQSGTLGIIYYGTGTGTNRTKTNLFFQASVNNGTTWSSVTQVSTAPTDETASPADLLNQYGDYNGLSVAGDVFFPCWTDRRDNESEAIFSAKISVTKDASGARVVILSGAPAKQPGK